MADAALNFDILARDRASGAFDRAGRAADTAAKRVQRMGRSMRTVGRNMTRSVTLPVVGAGVAAVKMASDFEDSMSKIVGLVGISQKQVDAWSGDILNMAKTLPQSPKELANAMFFVTSAGLRGKTALDALNQSARAAAAGLGDTQTVADAVTSAMNAYGPGTISASRATDILTAAVREGKLEASSLAPVIGKVLPIAKATGVGFEQVAGAMALMSKSGTDAAQSATQVTAILGTFAKPSAGMVKALGTMHLTLDGVRKSLANRGLVPTLATLREQAKKAGVDLSAVFGNKRALTGVLQLTGNLADTKAVMAGVANSAGSADKAFQTASRTASFKFKSALSTLQVIAIRLGNAVLPAVTKALAFVVSAMEKFSAAPKPVKIAVAAFVGLLAAIGPVVSIVGALVTAVGFLATPVGVVVAIVAALAIGFAVLYARSATFRAFVADKLVPALKTLWQDVLSGVGRVIQTISDHLKSNGSSWSQVGAVMLKVGGFITGVLMPILGQFIKLYFLTLAGAIGQVIDAISLFITVGKSIASVLAPVFRTVVSTFLGMVGMIIDGAARAFGWVKFIGPKLKAAADSFDQFRDRVNRALDGIKPEKDIRLKVTTQQLVLNPSMAKPRVVHPWTGGRIVGPGSGTSDSIPAMVSNGEYVIRAAAVARYGAGFFDRLNTMRFADGGHVGGSVDAPRGARIYSNSRSRQMVAGPGDSRAGSSGTASRAATFRDTRDAHLAALRAVFAEMPVVRVERPDDLLYGAA
jgi:TP901 family phage tail tape measure protein